MVHLTFVGSEKQVASTSRALHNDSMTIIITSMQENLKEKVLRRRKDKTTTTCIPLSYFCGDFLFHLFSHGSKATAAATSQQSSQENIRKCEEDKEETSGEETTTSSSHLGSQCSTNIGALQQHDHYHHDQCTSCEDISENGDILATCLHLYDVDIKDGTCYMFNPPQP